MKYILLALLLTSSAHAQVYATQEGRLTVIYQNKCKDVVNNDYACINSTQASQTPETLKQIKAALKNTGYKKKITIYSIDPIMRGKYTGDFDNDNVSYTFGAWVRKGKVYFAAMNECPNARWELERVLRKLARGRR